MNRILKVAIFCGMVLSIEIAVRAQDVVPGEYEARSFATPLNANASGVNGVTDRYGMPIGTPFIGPPWIRTEPAPDVETVGPAADATKRMVPGRSKAAQRRTTGKAKNTRRSRDVAKGPSTPVPRYFLPRGSLEWSPGPASINTSPANPYGYGYGVSGYGTEVFGDFWKGWPIVQY